MQLLPSNLTPLPISHTWAACQQPTVSATHGRFHSRRDDTKSVHSIFHHKYIRRWAASQWRSATLSCGFVLFFFFICHKPVLPLKPLWLTICPAALQMWSSPFWKRRNLVGSSEFLADGLMASPATLLSPSLSLSLFFFFLFLRQTEREVHRWAPSQTGCLATRAEQRLQCHSWGCQHRSWIILHWDSKKEKEWNRDEDRGESQGDGEKWKKKKEREAINKGKQGAGAQGWTREYEQLIAANGTTAASLLFLNLVLLHLKTL